MSERMPVIIDCDGGADSLWGLAVAASSPQLELAAVTVTAGKQSAENAFANAAAYAALLGLRCPLYRGSERSVLLREKPVWGKDGPDGRLGMALPAPAAYAPGHAWDAIYQAACRAEGALTVVCFGPMTNLAIALFKYEDLAEKLKKVVFVGGSYDFGNYTSVVEYNMATDPEAARAVFRSGVDRMMVGFNAMQKSALDDRLQQIVCAGGGAGAALFRQCCAGRQKTLGRVCFGGALAAAALARPQLVQSQRLHLELETRSSICRGRTVPITMYYPPNFEKDTDIVMEVDREGYAALLAAAVREMEVSR